MEKQTKNKLQFFIIAWVFAALVGAALTSIIQTYFSNFQFVDLTLTAAAIAITQMIVLQNYFEKVWFWAAMTFIGHLLTGFLIILFQNPLTSIYSSLSIAGTYVFIFILEIAIQTGIALFQLFSLKQEVSKASQWIVISIFSVVLSLTARILVFNLIYRFGNIEGYANYIGLFSIAIVTIISSLITGFGMSVLLQTKAFPEEMLLEELAE